jgi:uncharacterized protein YjbI with pentapeptide repeats
MSAGTAGEDRCQFELVPEMVPQLGQGDSLPDRETVHRELGTAACWRPASDGSDRCHWHRRAPNKSLRDLTELLAKDREAEMPGTPNLDGAYLAGLTVGETSRMSDLQLYDVSLAGAIVKRCTFEGTPFSNSDLRGALITDTTFRAAALREVHLEWGQLLGCEVVGADMESAALELATIWGCDLTDVDLERADLTECSLDVTRADDLSLVEADCYGANLEGVDLSESDLRGGQFTGARLHGTELDDARLNGQTSFEDVHAYDITDHQPAAIATFRGTIRTRLLTAFAYLNPATETPSEAPARAARVHRKLQRVLRGANRPGDVPHHYIREKHARRRVALAATKPLTWVGAALSRWTMLYGESPWRVLGTSLLVVGLWGVLFDRYGTFTVDPAVAPLGPVEWFYYSFVTFTTLGNGAFDPTSRLSYLLELSEAGIGAVLIALFVAVVVRRVTR